MQRAAPPARAARARHALCPAALCPAALYPAPSQRATTDTCDDAVSRNTPLDRRTPYGAPRPGTNVEGELVGFLGSPGVTKWPPVA